jgi:hypothetical protein
MSKHGRIKLVPPKTEPEKNQVLDKGLELCSLVPTCDFHEPLVSFPSRRKRYLLISKNTMRDLGFEIHAVSCSC